jgi:16S rRNA (adenine1518-N6/adenine1519-N6)-dimethyltransferase
MISKRKRLGQNFLVDKNIVRKFVELADIKKNETVLEIGGGSGLLTKEILKKTKKVRVIEKDKKFVEILKERFSFIEIIEGDALKVRLPSFDKCISSIPYSISSGITLELGKMKKKSYLMYQKEFGERLVAEPSERNYSRITIMTRYYFTPVLLKHVSRNSFLPRPKVDSVIVKLIPRRSKPSVMNEKFFFLVARALFNHKNQKVKKAFIHSRHEFDMDKDEAKKIRLEFEEKKVDDLSLEEIAELSNKLYKCLNTENKM